MLKDNIDFLVRNLTLQLQSYSSHRQSIYLLKVVLKLQDVDNNDIKDAIQGLLSQLDLSWLGEDKTLTTEILKIVQTFVISCEEKKGTKKKF